MARLVTLKSKIYGINKPGASCFFRYGKSCGAPGVDAAHNVA